MTEELCLIDTDILINILKRREPAYQQSLEYLKQHKKFSISCLTYYECLRGYQAIGATRRLKVFRKLLNITEVLYLDQAILDKAGEIYGVLRKKGLLPGEFDILIAATALIQDFTLSTNNEKHYEKMQEHFPLRINNWLKEI
jgi:predicted nucleic acid-binding protein